MKLYFENNNILKEYKVIMKETINGEVKVNKMKVLFIL